MYQKTWVMIFIISKSGYITLHDMNFSYKRTIYVIQLFHTR
jgi:hypothetical protein